MAIKTLRLPDEKDRHVLAAAINADADCIVTFNTRDFPTSYLKSFGIISKHPDDFVEQLMVDHRPQCLKALENQTEHLRNPPKSKAEVLEALKRCGLAKSAVLLESRLS